MDTASTKSSNRKKNRRAEGAPAKITPPDVAMSPQTRDISDRAWLICSLFIMAVAATLRLYNLSLVPFHHDEGVNGNFLVGLVRAGSYHYDPANYHGPTLYYFSAIIPWILRFLFGQSAQNTYGLNTVTVRVVPALFGLGPSGSCSSCESESALSARSALPRYWLFRPELFTSRATLFTKRCSSSSRSDWLWPV